MKWYLLVLCIFFCRQAKCSNTSKETVQITNAVIPGFSTMPTDAKLCIGQFCDLAYFLTCKEIYVASKLETFSKCLNLYVEQKKVCRSRTTDGKMEIEVQDESSDYSVLFNKYFVQSIEFKSLKSFACQSLKHLLNDLSVKVWLKGNVFNGLSYGRIDEIHLSIEGDESLELLLQNEVLHSYQFRVVHLHLEQRITNELTRLLPILKYDKVLIYLRCGLPDMSFFKSMSPEERKKVYFISFPGNVRYSNDNFCEDLHGQNSLRTHRNNFDSLNEVPDVYELEMVYLDSIDSVEDFFSFIGNSQFLCSLTLKFSPFYDPKEFSFQEFVPEVSRIVESLDRPFRLHLQYWDDEKKCSLIFESNYENKV